jgi:hypothetical protein
MIKTSAKTNSETKRRLFITAAPFFLALIFFASNTLAGAEEGSAPPGDTAALLPGLDGWTRDGEAQVYTPESLFEYIDGAADAYLAYDFEELAVLSYNGENKRSITVEIYRHSDLRNAFGIYTQERPQQGNFVPAGTEGYYDAGILNFFHGPYYVKVMGFRLESDDRAVLTAVAKDIAARIGGAPVFPDLLACFPADGRVAHSERYFARDVLGHGFLHSAYAADYESKGAVVRLYLFEGKDETDARKMTDDYLKLAGAGAPTRKDPSGKTETYRFKDPRRTAGDPASFRLSGRFFWGLFATDSAAGSYLDRLETSLKERGLVD